ncbi:MAG: hypothetical protein KAG45_01980 [Methyloprofundus sp.]|nr:hypothetical protein [Methyloprofundus sp.]
MNRYLTDYDDSLTGESHIDPMGMLVIWSAYGHQIFQNRVNSISNDVRNYTLNLFNHYLIRRIISDESVLLSRELLHEYGSKDTLNFKYACLLYLENLFVYSILQNEEHKGVDSSGVLGSSNARRLWVDADNDPVIIFTHKKAGQILVRQLGLGVSGRYKTPMMEIGYFDKHYHYTSPSAISLWQEAEQFIANQSKLKKLAKNLIEHFKEDLFSQRSPSPSISFSDVPDVLRKDFASAFSSPGAVGNYAREYWISVTGLDDGASKALLQVLDNNAKLDKPKELDPQNLIESALKQTLSDEERLKMTQIASLEPFLSDIMLMFTLLTAKKSRPLTEVITQWQEFGRTEHTLPQRANLLRSDVALNNVINGSTAGRRMKNLLQLADTATLDDQVTLLLEYHNNLMLKRSQMPWLTLDNAGRQVKVHVRPLQVPDTEDWPPGEWYYSYYLPQFKSLVRGFQGVVEG